LKTSQGLGKKKKKNSDDVDNAFLLSFLEFVKGHCFDCVFGLMMTQVRIETDPADRSQLRMTVASGEPALTYEYVRN
jgi:hypothetical protein